MTKILLCGRIRSRPQMPSHSAQVSADKCGREMKRIDCGFGHRSHAVRDGRQGHQLYSQDSPTSIVMLRRDKDAQKSQLSKLTSLISLLRHRAERIASYLQGNKKPLLPHPPFSLFFFVAGSPRGETRAAVGLS